MNIMLQINKNLPINVNEGNVLTIKTVQIAPFRTLMTALKDILLETNISFCKLFITKDNLSFIFLITLYFGNGKE